MIRSLLRPMYHRMFPNLHWLPSYKSAVVNDLGCHSEYRDRVFKELVASSTGKKCLQIGVMFGAKFAPHWISVDLFDKSPLIDFNYDVHDMPFPDGSFDIVVCNAVLEHVPYPQKAIKELVRVLKPGGEIWIEIPWMQPFHEVPKDYWRATPDGLRVWMEGMQEIKCGHHRIKKSNIYSGTFYHGRKPV